MDMHITKDEKKPLLKKRTLTGRIGYDDKTPARLDVRKEIAHKFNAKPEMIIIRRISPETGSRSASFEADVYEDEKTLKAVEHNYMLERHGIGEKKEEKPVEQKE